MAGALGLSPPLSHAHTHTVLRPSVLPMHHDNNSAWSSVYVIVTTEAAPSGVSLLSLLQRMAPHWKVQTNANLFPCRAGCPRSEVSLTELESRLLLEPSAGRGGTPLACGLFLQLPNQRCGISSLTDQAPRCVMGHMAFSFSGHSCFPLAGIAVLTLDPSG